MGCGSSNDTNNPRKGDQAQYNNFVLRHEKRSYKQDYLIGKLLGEGAFGQVYVCKSKKNQEIRVLKKMSKEGLTDEELKKNMVTDVMVLQNLTHPSILKTYEFYDDEYMFYIVSEYCEGGALLDRIITQEMLSESEAASVMKQALEAINYTHQQGYMHRDLKLENIVLDEKTKTSDVSYPIKIIDYGCATQFKKGEKFEDLCGTPIYIAPEVIKGEYNEKCDIWSLGVLLYILLSGAPPFSGEGMDELFENIKQNNYDFSDSVFDSVSDQAKDLVKQMLNPNYEQRLSCIEALQHPWFKNASSEKISQESKEKALNNLKKFQVKSKLQSAIHSYIATQLVTKAEQKNMAVAFKQIDKDGSGTLSKQEITHYFQEFQMSGEQLEEHVNQIMDKLDENGNGTINYNEFITASLDAEKVTSEKNLKQAFEFFDQDQSGFITTDEIKKLLGKDFGKQPDGSKLLQQLTEFDKDGDHKINFDEFNSMMKSMNASS